MIPLDAYYTVLNIIEAGDLKKAQYVLTKYMAKATEEAHQRQLEIAQATAKANQEMALMTEQAKAQTRQIDIQGKLQEIEAESLAKIKELQEQHRLKMEEIEKQGGIQMDIAVATTKQNNRNRMEQ